MSQSYEWTNWHLTCDGWVSGSYKVDGQCIHVQQPPKSTVLICRFYEILQDSKGRWHRDLETLWTSPDAETVASLLSKFGDCPEQV